MKYLKLFEAKAYPLFNLLENDDLPSIIELLKKGVDVNQKDIQGNTPLHYACYLRFYSTTEIKINEKIIKFLIESGADINAKNDFGETPLMHCELTHKVKILLKLGADFFIRDNNGKDYLDRKQDKFFKYSYTTENVENWMEYLGWYDKYFPKLLKERELRKEAEKYNL